MNGARRAPRPGAYLVGLQAVSDGAAAPAERSGSAAPAGLVQRALEWDVQQCMDELARLADSAGLRVTGRAWQRRRQPDPRTYLGAGKIAAVAESARE